MDSPPQINVSYGTILKKLAKGLSPPFTTVLYYQCVGFGRVILIQQNGKCHNGGIVHHNCQRNHITYYYMRACTLIYIQN